MKRIIFLFWVISQVYSTKICSKIYKIPSTSLKKGVCQLKGKVQTTDTHETIYIQKCYPGFHCEASGSSIGLCKADYSLKIEEENCNFDFDCYSNNCTNNICYPIKTENACQSHFQCEVSAFCNSSGICKKLAEKEQFCQTDYDCAIGLGCSQEKCVEMFSFEKGTYTNNRYLCKSGYIKDNVCADTSGVTSIKTCNSDEECPIEIDKGDQKKINENGICECNLEGVKYCSLTSNSEEWRNYVATFKSTIKNINDIHIAGMRNVKNELLHSWGSSTIVDAYRKFDVKYINVNKDILIALGSKFLCFHRIIFSVIFFTF